MVSQFFFQDYVTHVNGPSHTESMRKLKDELSQRLSQWRIKQRAEQKELETRMKEEGRDVDENGRKFDPLFCKTCKLVFTLKRSDHNDSEMHRRITNFLQPTCKLCSEVFFSPMAYEKHLDSQKHLEVSKIIVEKKIPLWLLLVAFFLD